MAGNLNKIAESNDYSKDVISNDATRRLEEFKQHFLDSTPDEQNRIAQDWDERVNKYMDPELKAAATGNVVENTEKSDYVKESSVKNVENVKALLKAIDNYPDVPEAQKKATEDIVYGRVSNVEEDATDVLEQNKIAGGSDENVEE